MSKKPFIELPDRKEYEKIERPKYVPFKEGTPVVVRILDEYAHGIDTHYITKSKLSIACIGDDCPICMRNEELRGEFPDSFRDNRAYISRTRRYMVNVLDRTPVVIEPETGDEYYAIKGQYPTTTKDGNTSLVGIEPKPSNKVKILARGRNLFELLGAINDETDGLTKFDIKFVTIGSGPKMVITPMPMPQNDDVAPILEANSLIMHVLSTIGIFLTAEEIKAVLKGVSLKDIYAQRRIKEEEEEILKSESIGQISVGDLSSKIDALFGGDNDLETSDGEA